jgi:serine/threonine protein kinase
MAPGQALDGFGPYRVVRQIGSGGMASIFEAVDPRLGHRVALKRLHPHIAERPGAAARFLREGRAAARIRHPHVVQVFALGDDESSPYLAMELLEGSDLGAVLAREGRLGVEAALELLLPVMAGVAAAHDAGVLHRDLKPSNVFVANGARGKPWPKVVDFGVSKVLDDDGGGPATATDGVVGTAAYMAPEQARAVREASFRSDQYSLGVILYQCLTGELPFATGGMYDLMVAIMTAPVKAPSERGEGIARELDEIVLRAMSRNPRDRFPSVRAFGAALLSFARERDRVAWSAELHPEEEQAPAGDAPRIEPVADPHATMSPTARDTRAASRRQKRTLRRAVAAVAGAIAVVAGVATWSVHEAARPASTAPLGAAVALPAAPAPTAIDSATTSPAPPSNDTSPNGTSSPSQSQPQAAAPLPTHERAFDPQRRAPASSASAAPSAVASASVPLASASAKRESPVIGDNGAPILP